MALFAMGLGVLVIANDFTALNVALPAIEQDFDVDVGTVQWTVNAYALTFGMVLVTGGRLADMFGRRRIFFIGTAIFALFSLLGGLAQNADQLIAMRVGMGVGRRAHVAGDPRHDLRRRPARARRLRWWPGPGCRRPRQRDRPADRRRAHRRDQLARDLLPQPADRRLRRRRDRGEDPPAGARRRRACAHRLRAASSPSRWGSCSSCWRSTNPPTGAGAIRVCWRCWARRSARWSPLR